MKIEERAALADYIAEGLRYAMKGTGLEWPKDTVIVTKSYNEIADIDEILGMKVYIVDALRPFEWFVGFPSENVKSYKLQKELMEYIDIYPYPLTSG